MSKRTKRTFCFLMILMIVVGTVGIPTGASYSDLLEYNPRLADFGITEERYNRMPMSHKEIYGNIEFAAKEECVTEQVTKYFFVPAEPYVPQSTYGAKDLIQERPYIEVSKEEYESVVSYSNMDERLQNPDSTSGTWYSLLTEVAYMGTQDGNDCFILSNTLSVLPLEFGGARENTYTGFLAGGLNALCSPISGTEIFDQENVYFNSSEDLPTVYEAPHKGAGYGFDFTVDSLMREANLSMSFLFEPNTTTVKLIDAYGFAGYWRTDNELDASISIGGPSISIAPTLNLYRASDTHAQMRR